VWDLRVISREPGVLGQVVGDVDDAVRVEDVVPRGEVLGDPRRTFAQDAGEWSELDVEADALVEPAGPPSCLSGATTRSSRDSSFTTRAEERDHRRSIRHVRRRFAHSLLPHVEQWCRSTEPDVAYETTRSCPLVTVTASAPSTPTVVEKSCFEWVRQMLPVRSPTHGRAFFWLRRCI